MLSRRVSRFRGPSFVHSVDEEEAAEEEEGEEGGGGGKRGGGRDSGASNETNGWNGEFGRI